MNLERTGKGCEVLTWMAWKWEDISSPCWQGRCWLRSLRAHGSPEHCASLCAKRRQHHNFSPSLQLPERVGCACAGNEAGEAAWRTSAAMVQQQRRRRFAAGSPSLQTPQGRKKQFKWRVNSDCVFRSEDAKWTPTRWDEHCWIPWNWLTLSVC